MKDQRKFDGLRIISSAIPLIVFLLFILSNLSAQQKGASPISIVSGQQSMVKNTYAVVVGISDYQDKDIPDLRFADKDAEAFANFLRSEAGGKLDVNHLKVLINSEATMAQFAIALDWLWEVCKENDRAIIYFSGHGDVEKKSITQPGYLLCWDAPAHVYMSGGAFALPMFQDVITTLSTQNKAKVIIITDACRSGKLSGTSVGGAQITGSNLAKQYANEIKILSCQPNEFSIEGNQWGGGRGAFSYHLLQGLYGMADLDSDHQVTLKELGKYLEERVSEEVSPLQQNPMVVGSVTEKIANVIPEILSSVKDGNLNRIMLFSSIDSRGIADEVLANVDSSIVNLYFAFYRALKDKQFLFAEIGRNKNDYADYYYKILIAEPKLERLYSAITRNYAAALQDDAQQTINEWLKTSQNSTLNLKKIESKARVTNKIWTEKVRSFPRCLERAAELLGSRHYMYKVILARSKFFEGYLLANTSNNPDADMGYRAISLLRQSLVWLPDQPQVYWQMGRVYASLIPRPDSLEYYTRQALELIPNWTFVCCDAAFYLANKFKMFDRAELYLNQASKSDSASSLLRNAWGAIYSITHRYREAELVFKKVIQFDST
ncbi:MAG TPA: caspase family protein, partial [Saprospiraceae bacterium]|nr:caspase family protein [Saprospiraceae bacterium]